MRFIIVAIIAIIIAWCFRSHMFPIFKSKCRPAPGSWFPYIITSNTFDKILESTSLATIFAIPWWLWWRWRWWRGVSIIGIFLGARTELYSECKLAFIILQNFENWYIWHPSCRVWGCLGGSWAIGLPSGFVFDGSGKFMLKTSGISGATLARIESDRFPAFEYRATINILKRSY